MITVKIFDEAGDFAEDKDTAAEIRESLIRKGIAGRGKVRLDFEGVTLTTQSFIHALISDVLRSEGEDVLKKIEFKNCDDGVRGIIETVVQYSLETMDSAT